MVVLRVLFPPCLLRKLLSWRLPTLSPGAHNSNLEIIVLKGHNLDAPSSTACLISVFICFPCYLPLVPLRLFSKSCFPLAPIFFSPLCNYSLILTQVPGTQAVADMLRENRSLQSLNIESNFISSTGLMAVLKAVRENSTLTELRVDNQVSIPFPWY